MSYHTYQWEKTSRADGYQRVVIRRSDGRMADSGWWGVCDGSAEADANNKMAKIEAAEQAQADRERLAIEDAALAAAGASNGPVRP
jgi:hypothetical protein